MKLVVWNSQGGKWDIFWTSHLSPIHVLHPREDVIGFLVESGWAPWVVPGVITVNEEYMMDSDKTWFDWTSASNSAFCVGIASKRGYQAMWIPWI